MDIKKLLEYILLVLVFPGFLFSSAMGMITGWVDRKVTARLQWRVGPPWYQNFADTAKLLFYKETLIPEGVSKIVFLGMPILAVSAATLVSTMLLVINFSPRASFIGDVIVLIYILLIPSLAVMLAAFASANPLASLGASREMKLILSYELPFILSLIVPIIKSGYIIKLGGIILAQNNTVPVIGSISGVISFFTMLVCIQAKLGLTPFDMAEAETEIMAGTYIEYSGKALGLLKLAKSIIFFAAPILLITLYFGGIKFTQAFAESILQYLLILVLMIVIKNTNPRVRIDHAVRFFWSTMTLFAILSVLLAYMGY